MRIEIQPTSPEVTLAWLASALSLIGEDRSAKGKMKGAPLLAHHARYFPQKEQKAALT